MYGPKGIGKSHALFVIAHYFKRLFDIGLSPWRVLYIQNWNLMTEDDVNDAFVKCLEESDLPALGSTSIRQYIRCNSLKWLVIIDQLHDTKGDQAPSLNHSKFFPNKPNKCLVVTASSPHRNEAKLDGEITSTHFFNETFSEDEVAGYLKSFRPALTEEDLDEIGLKKEEVEGEFFDDDSEFEE